jgi:uncharacterized protein YndB with AHSA1/START domain
MTDMYELTVTRHIDAPRSVVWQAFTDRMAEWWAPTPWTTEIVERDMRAGGRSAMVMRGPGGEEAPMEGVFLEVKPAELVVFTDAFTVGWVPQGPFFVGIMAFEDDGSGTRYTARARHWTEESYQGHKAMGFEQGWATVADQLAAVAEAMART